MSVIAPTTAGIGDLIPREGTLTPAECEALARAVVRARGLWEHVELTPTASGTRAYALLHETDDVEIWVLSWRPGHTTGYHDHGTSNVGFCIADGALLERQLRFAEPPLEQTVATDEARSAGSDYIHYLAWHEGAPAISVHVYSPPLSEVGQYRIREDGVLRRETQSGREELTLD